MNIAVQQIMLGKAVKTENQLQDALEKIRSFGYNGLELNHFMLHPASFFVRMLTALSGMPIGNTGKLPWMRIIKQIGMPVAGLHTDLGSLERNAQELVQEAKEIGTDKLIITGMYRFDYQNAEQIQALCDRLNRMGEVLKKNDMQLLYHNHNVELLRIAPEKCAYDLLMEKTDEELLGFEFDSYWFAVSGADTVYWANKLGRRMKLWHINDFGFRQERIPMTPIIKGDAIEPGKGNLPLEKLWEIAVSNETEAVILEMHKNHSDQDPLKSIQISADWFRKRGA